MHLGNKIIYIPNFTKQTNNRKMGLKQRTLIYFMLGIFLTSCTSKDSRKTATESLTEAKVDATNIHNQEAVKWHNKAVSEAVRNPTSETRTTVLRYLDKATFIDPHFEKAYYTKIQFLLELGRNQEALSTADSCIKYNPNNGAHYLTKAMIMRWMGENGKDLFQKSIDMTMQELARPHDSINDCRLIYNIVVAKTILGEKNALDQLRVEKDKFEVQYQKYNNQAEWEYLFSLLRDFNEEECIRNFLNISNILSDSIKIVK